MDLAHLKTFYIIAREGSLTKAAHVLNTSQSSLSRTLQTLEYYAKTQLFERHARGLKLTPQGEKVFQHAQKIVQEHENFKRSFSDNHNEMEGELKIITTPGMASIWLADLIPEFLKQYPGVRLDIDSTLTNYSTLTNLEKDKEKADILIRTRIDYHPNLIQKHILSSHYKLWASPEYLKKFGIPKKSQELDYHNLLIFEKRQFNVLANNHWILEIGSNVERPRQPFFIMNSLEGLISCAKKGLGIIQMPEELLKLRNNQNELLHILEDEEGPIIDIYCIYTIKPNISKKIILFTKFLETSF